MLIKTRRGIPEILVKHDAARLVEAQERDTHRADGLLGALVANIKDPAHILVRARAGVVECFSPHKFGVLRHAQEILLHRLAAAQGFQSVVEENIRRVKAIHV